MSETTLVAELRTRFGKGAARQIRREHKIPAVIYGHGTQPVHVALPGHETMMALKTANALLAIQLDGKSQLVLAKDIQRDPIKPVIEHIDLVVVRRGEKVVVDVPVHLEGDAAAETVVTLESQTLQVSAEATHIPDHVVVSVDGLPAGTQVKASDVQLPQGSELVTDAETLVANVVAQISEGALEAELAEAEADAGITHDEPEAAAGEAAGAGAGAGAAEPAEAPAAGDADERG